MDNKTAETTSGSLDNGSSHRWTAAWREREQYDGITTTSTCTKKGGTGEGVHLSRRTHQGTRIRKGVAELEASGSYIVADAAG